MTDTRDQNKFLVRMPDGMRDRLRAEAAKNSRSMNSEIVARLERSFGDPDPGVLDTYKAMAIQQRVIMELVDIAGIKLPKKMRDDIEKMTREAEGRPYAD